MRKAFSTLMISLVLLASGVLPAGAQSFFGVSMVEIGLQNYLSSTLARGNPQGSVDANCSALGEGPCDFDLMRSLGSDVGSHDNLPYCKTELQTYCVESLKVYEPGVAAVDATYKVQIGSNLPTISSNLEHGLPEVAQPIIFTSTQASSVDGSNDFMVAAAIDFHFSAPDYLAQIGGLKLSVLPVQEFGEHGYDTGAILIKDFAPSTRVAVNLRLPNQVGGWFKGRLSDANVNITPLDSSNYLLSVDGQSVSVPVANAVVKPEEWEQFKKTSGWDLGAYRYDDSLNIESDGLFNFLEAMRPLASDTSTAIKTAWSITSFPGADPYNCQPAEPGFTGLVSTNATVYTGAPPELTTSGLAYKLAGWHFLPDGESIAKGKYDLVIREDVARCIYGLPDNGYLSASMSVSDGGATQSSTQSFDVANGFVHIGVSDFHFSQPVVKSKLKIGSYKKLDFPKILAKINGVKAKNKLLTLTLSGLPKGTKLVYKWFANGRQIIGANGSTLRVTSSLVSKHITASVTLTKYAYKDKKVTISK